MIANIALDDALILPHRANPRRIEFSGTTGGSPVGSPFAFAYPLRNDAAQRNVARGLALQVANCAGLSEA